MAIFSYEARDKNGVLLKGKIQANSSDQAADKLIKDNLIPINIQMLSELKSWKLSNITLFNKKIPNEVLIVFCRQLYSLEKAGIPIVSSIKRLSEIMTHPALATALKEVSKEISAGTALSTALSHHPKIFPPLLIALVTSGEANGHLDEALLAAAKHFEFANTSRKRIKGILRYPLLVISFSFSAIMLINVFVIPRFAELYANFHAELPLPTRLLIYFSNFIRNHAVIILFFILLFTALIYYCFHQPRFQIFIDRQKMKLPIFGSIIERVMMADFSRSIGMLLETGITLTQALNLTADIMNNQYAKEKVLEMLGAIRRGKNFSQAANATHFLSPLILQVLAIGEKTGNVNKLLLEISTSYEEEIDYDISKLADKVQPILLLFVGGIVLILALGVFLPMWSLTQMAR